MGQDLGVDGDHGGHPGEPITFEREGKPKADAVRIVWHSKAGGARLVTMHPEHGNRKSGHYHADLHVQGWACSSSRDGLAAIDGIRGAVERYLWPGVPTDSLVTPETQGEGMMDLCVDFEIGRGWELPKASQWIDREVFCFGKVDAFGARFATRASKREQTAQVSKLKLEAKTLPVLFRGGPVTGRTGTLGKSPRLMIYEKDKHHPRTQSLSASGRDLPVVKEQWKARGWDGESRVIRLEFSVTRNWLAKNDIVRIDHTGGVTTMRLAGPTGMTWPAMVEWLPSILATLLVRFRMKDRLSRKRLDRRDDAPLWKAAFRAARDWNARLAREHGMAREDWATGAIMSRARKMSKEMAERRFEGASVDLHTHLAHESPDVSLPTVIAAAVDRIVRGESFLTPEQLADRVRARRERLNLTPARYGFKGKPPPPTPPTQPTMLERERVLELIAAELDANEGTRTGDVLAKLLKAIEAGERRRE